MKRHFRLLVVLGLLFSLSAPAVWAQQTQPGGSAGVLKYGVMRPDPETRERWHQDYLNAPESFIDPTLSAAAPTTGGAVPTSGPIPSLLDHITYTPSERNQGACGNCGVWAATAALETKHSVETGVKDRLSVQWYNSASYDGTPNDDACNGVWPADVVSFYNSHVFVPWSNKNASFQDGSWKKGDGPAIKASSITNKPNYNSSVNAFETNTIPTYTVDQATAIANVENVLLQRKAVAFTFWLPTGADWSYFQNTFWDSDPESTIWDPDSVCGTTEDKGQAGHSVTVVGYDVSNSNPDKHYWIVLNSWGANAKRPNGLFRMKMNMNYQCTETETDAKKTIFQNRYFQNVETASGKTPFINKNKIFMAEKGATSDTIWNTDKAAGGSWPSTWTEMNGKTDHTPALATFNTRQYMAVKCTPGSNVIDICSMDSTGTWTSWTGVAGSSTDGAPALVTYRNKLYLFQKNTGLQTISYAYMNTSGVWSAWSTVPGSGTSHSPAVVVCNDQLHVLWTGLDGKVCLNSMKSDGTWAGWVYLYWNLITDAAPAATVFNNSVYVVVKGVKQTTPGYSDKISYANSIGNPRTTWYTWRQIPGGANTAHGPMIGTGPDVKTLNVTITGQTSTDLYMQSFVNGTGWASGWSRISGFNSNVAPSLNTYWF